MTLDCQIFLFSLAILSGLIFENSYRKNGRKLVRRLRDCTGGGDTIQADSWGYFLNQKIVAVGRYVFLRRFFSKKDAATFSDLIISAGLRPDPWLHISVGSKFILMIVFFVLSFVISIYAKMNHESAIVFAIISALLGASLPEWTLKIFVSRYRKSLLSGLPDMLDLMVICAEAGLPLETIIERTAEEIRFSSPPVTQELNKLRSDLKMFNDSRLALKNFGYVPDIEPLRRLAVTLMQSMKFGTPLSETLRVLSAELRRERLIEAEEKAGRLPAILTIPMVVFILPSIFCLLLGPAVLRLLHSLT